MADRFTVNGYQFENEELYNEACKEAETVAYIRQRTNLTNTVNTLKLYNKLLDTKQFYTPVGIAFLKELYDRIIDSSIISKDNLRPLAIYEAREKKGRPVDAFAKEEESKLRIRLSVSENKLRNTRIVVFFCAVIILVMFALTIFGDNSPLIDAEIRIQDKYSEWQEELDYRERQIELKEKELGIR